MGGRGPAVARGARRPSAPCGRAGRGAAGSRDGPLASFWDGLSAVQRVGPVSNMIVPRDETYAEPSRSVSDLLGDAAAPVLTYVEGDIHSRCGMWTEAQWRPGPCGCGAAPLAANHEVGELDFEDGRLPPPVGCGCHVGVEDRTGWFSVAGESGEAVPFWPDPAGTRFPSESLAGVRQAFGWRETSEEGARVAPTDGGELGWVDIYFSAGQRRNWDAIADDIVDDGDSDTPVRAYRSCDDGNDRSCEIWRVRWHFATGLATATAVKVVGREDFDLNDAALVGLTRPAVSPDGRHLAYAWREWKSDNTFDEGGEFAVRVRKLSGPMAGDAAVAEPLPWGGGVGWPAWMDDDTLAVANEMSKTRMEDGDRRSSNNTYQDAAGKTRDWTPFDASFKTVQQVPLKDTTLGKAADGDPFPIRGMGVRYVHLDYVLNPAESEALAEMGVATDPHAHANAKYGARDRRGLRVATFGNRHDEELGDAATTVVFDPTVDDPLGELAETFQKPTETYAGADEADAGLHHPSWNITGDMVQVSHQESAVDITDFISRRGLHGFRWNEAVGRWVPWNWSARQDLQGRLFPNALDRGTSDGDRWWEGLPGTLEASAEGLPTLPDPVTDKANRTEERCATYVWKYGAFCGSDEYVVAQFACINPDWPVAVFGDALRAVDPVLRDEKEKQLGRLAQLMSRVVLIRRSDGHHWDLTSVVEEALEEAGAAFGAPTVFGLYPTCGALQGVLDAEP